MLSPNGILGNGRATYPPCESDYPVVEIEPAVPAKPAPWKSQFSAFTHNISWTDADQCTHSLTLRSDDPQALFSDLRMVKGLIRASKEKAKERHPDAPQAQTQPEMQPEHVVCRIHGVEMERRVSKRTGGHYHAHKMGPRDLCFGKVKS